MDVLEAPYAQAELGDTEVLLHGTAGGAHIAAHAAFGAGVNMFLAAGFILLKLGQAAEGFLLAIRILTGINIHPFPG